MKEGFYSEQKKDELVFNLTSSSLKVITIIRLIVQETALILSLIKIKKQAGQQTIALPVFSYARET